MSALALNLPENSDFDTIGGLVFSELGHIPVAGEQLTRDDVSITVSKPPTAASNGCGSK